MPVPAVKIPYTLCELEVLTEEAMILLVEEFPMVLLLIVITPPVDVLFIP
jgi:hypothetical protein